MINGYDAAVKATNRGRKIAGLTRLSDTGLMGDDYSRALRMITEGHAFSYTDGRRRIILTAA